MALAVPIAHGPALQQDPRSPAAAALGPAPQRVDAAPASTPPSHAQRLAVMLAGCGSVLIAATAKQRRAARSALGRPPVRGLHTQPALGMAAPAEVSPRVGKSLGEEPAYAGERRADASSLVERAIHAASEPIDNSFLRGNFGPVATEHTAMPLEVLEGAIPPDFPHGTYVRNGPNPYHEPVSRVEPILGRTCHHWFEGDGMLHAVRFMDGTASYTNRWVRTAGLKQEMEAQRSLFRGTFDVTPTACVANMVSNAVSGQEMFKSTANTSVCHHAGALLALNEGFPPTRVRLSDLETEGEHVFGNEVVPCPYGRQRREFTAHPKIDPGTGELIFFSSQAAEPYLTMGVVGPDGDLKHLAPIGDIPYATVKHDFAITERFSLILDFPFTIFPERLLEGRPPAAWEGDAKPSRIGVMPRHGTNEDVRWFEVETGWVFHVVNAYEEGDTVVLHACRAPGTDLTPSAQGNDWAEKSWKLGSIFHNRIYEWRLDLATGECTEKALSPFERWPEFPTVSCRVVGRRHHFAYCVDYDYRISRVTEAPASPCLIKYALPEGTFERHELGPGRFGEEVTFVPRGGPGAAEDDGWVVGFVFNEEDSSSELVIIDAQKFTGPPVCRLSMPRVPFGFHGTFVPDEQ